MSRFGGGGHSREILSRLSSKGRLFSFDQDADAEQNIRDIDGQQQGMGRFTFVRSNFRYLKNWMHYYRIEKIDGLLGDLGVSSHHFDDEERGFSFRFDAPLDMRMNKRAGKTAADILQDYDEGRLADLFYLYGELKNSRKIAAAIVNRRKEKPILSTADFQSIVDPLFKKEREKKEMAKLFQALLNRSEPRDGRLREMMQATQECLRPGGRISIITYHSLEDRIVKNMMKTGNAEAKG